LIAVKNKEKILEINLSVLLILIMTLSSFTTSLAATKRGTLTLRANSKVIKLGKPLFFRGRLLNHSGRPIRGRAVVLQRKHGKFVIRIIRGKKKKVKRYFWRSLGSKKTNSKGIYTFGLKPTKSATYRVRSLVYRAPKPVVSRPVGVIVKPAPAPQPAAPGTNAGRLGFSEGNNLVWLGDAELDSQLNSMAALGVKWIRHDLHWSTVQASGPNSWSWSAYDRLVNEVSKRNINILFILDYTPGWARRADASGTMFSAPANNAQFAAYAKAAVAHFSPMGVKTYEVWNEPNLVGFWRPAPNIAVYSDLLKKTYVAIKEADPTAIVVSGGLSPAATTGGNIAPLEFASGMYAKGVKGYFDAFGFHPYSYPALPSSTANYNAWYQMFGTSPNLRGIMQQYDDSAKPVYGTEFGAPTAGSVSWSPNNSESLQAQIIDSAWAGILDKPWLTKVFIHSYKDIGTSTSTIENFFGVVRYNGTLKPAYYSVQNILSK